MQHILHPRWTLRRFPWSPPYRSLSQGNPYCPSTPSNYQPEIWRSTYSTVHCGRIFGSSVHGDSCYGDTISVIHRLWMHHNTFSSTMYSLPHVCNVATSKNLSALRTGIAPEILTIFEKFQFDMSIPSYPSSPPLPGGAHVYLLYRQYLIVLATDNTDEV